MFTYDEIMPWGRSFDEYVHMFDLSPTDLNCSILGCADGPASFNAGLHRLGGQVVSVDPLYQFSAVDIKRRFEIAYKEVMHQTEVNVASYIWDQIPSLDELGRRRRLAMEEFIKDYDQGKAEKRYLPFSLPELPFQDQQFDLALCSHFLFLYSEQLSGPFHQEAAQEMLRVAKEVRIFPLISLEMELSPHLNRICTLANASGKQAAIQSVPYEFQRGANQMLRIW